MKRFRPTHRRILAVAGSAVIGLVGAVALASPASAHHSVVTGEPYCDTTTGEWVVTWNVNTVAPADTYRLLEVTSTPAEFPVSGIEVTEGEGFPHQTGIPLTGEQRLPGDATSASLTVRSEWDNGYFETEEKAARGEVTFGGLCEKPNEPGTIAAQHSSDCEELVVTITNPEDGVETTVQVTTSAEGQEELTLAPGESRSVSFPGEEGLSYQVTVDEQIVAEGGWQEPEDCQPEEVTVPIAQRPDCDTLTVEVTNPLEDEALEVTISDGDVTETLTIEPGDTGEVTFEAEEGTVATVTIGEESIDIAWEEPEGCDEPAGGGGDLPVTGSSTGIVAGAALALLVVGGGLFLLARRRRITFTA